MTDPDIIRTLTDRIRRLEAEIREQTFLNEAGGIDPTRILQGTPIPTFVIDRRHVITHYNRACERLTGFSAAELIGTRNQWKAFYDHERPVMADLLVDDAAWDTIRKYYGEACWRSHVIDGAYEAEGFFPRFGASGKWLFFTAAPIRNDAGDLIGAIETLQDITERRAAEAAVNESRRRYRTLLDFIPHPILVNRTDGRVSYVNPAFTEGFGWDLADIEGGKIPFIPEDLEKEAAENLLRLKKERILPRCVTRRLTRDGDVRHVAVTAALYPAFQDEPGGVLEIMRDITREIQDDRRNEAILRISRALPEYPDLEELLDYISREIQQMINTEGALVILHDEERSELYFLGAAYDDAERGKRVKEIRFGMNELMAGQVIRTGQPLMVLDAQKTASLYPERDKRFGYQTRNFLLVPLRSGERIIGVLAALNIKKGEFDPGHVETLTMLAGSVALSIENARYAETVKKAYREVTSLNQAKDKAITHLSHELKTPVAIIGGSLSILTKFLADRHEGSWRPAVDRAMRNLHRIVQILEEVEDIMQDAENVHKRMLSEIVDHYGDLIESLAAEAWAEGRPAPGIGERLQDLFTMKKSPLETIDPSRFICDRLDALAPVFSHRHLTIGRHLTPSSPVTLPSEVFRKIVDGLIRNAVENTPDEGEIDISVSHDGAGACLTVHDWGIGLTEEAVRRVFGGFFANRDSHGYSSKRPFDFGAGGKGADLLRMKIFSERYHFTISVSSTRCGFIPKETDICPGRISHCRFCQSPSDCRQSGETVFTLLFQPPSSDGALPHRNRKEKSQK